MQRTTEQMGRRPHIISIAQLGFVNKLSPMPGNLGRELSMTLIALLSILLSSLVNAAESQVTQIKCGSTEFRIASYCRQNDSSTLARCDKQELTINLMTSGRTTTLTFRAMRDNSQREQEFVAGAWACVKGMGQPYLVITFDNGGNCEKCEYLELISTQGVRLTPNGNGFEKDYRRLGLPKKLPTLMPIKLIP